MGYVEENLRRRQPSVDSKTSSSNGSSTPTGLPRKWSFPMKPREESIKRPHEKIVHHPQDSLFSTSSGFTNYRGFFNLAILLLVVSNGRLALENVIKYGILISPLQWLSFMMVEGSIWNWPNLTLVLFSNITILTVFITEKILEKGYLGNYFAGVFYPLLIVAHLIFPAVVTLLIKDHPLCSVCALSVFVIESLKLVSYVHVNYWCRCARSEAVVESKKMDITDGEVSNAELTSLYPGNLTLCNLYYFMVAPTLCYELKFPLSVRRRKTFLIKRFIELVFLTFLIAALVQQWVVPIIHNSVGPLSEMEIGRSLERLLKLAIPNIIIWLIGFYTIFHSALNFIAEVLRFADREFYRDFWNSETIHYFWRTWNIPVHRWATRHIYLPMMRNNYKSLLCSLCLHFFHEYLVSVPLHMFRLWAYYGMMSQIPLSIVTDRIIKGGRAGNVVVWLSLILGQPLCILMYVHDWCFQPVQKQIYVSISTVYSNLLPIFNLLALGKELPSNAVVNTTFLINDDSRPASIASSAMISMYKTTFEERTYFVYWLPLPKIIGVCSGVDEVYELMLSEKDRAKFVKVSETILPTIWREAMGDKAFVISSIVSGSHCVISFGTKQTLTLKANREVNRIRLIMEEMLNCIEGPSTTMSLRRRKRPKREIQWEED
ncbi:hypothetical protein KIN20_032844 [Parelaphostrongylus tenuis]|uniref:O-acyltransferase n=1 Tax=Parelaphostrongylus tenuis TaxID=148309 RepID=A0AAD5WHY7_PARTN|nr:hypothetical protein KIN20_032844 [Parelaphostrongylus tenuis]